MIILYNVKIFKLNEYPQNMKLQNSIYSVRKKTIDPHGTINRIAEENQSLRAQLLEATDKQHQEMSRAIDLKEKNVYLRSRIHEAKIEACKLRDLNSKLKNI